MEPSVPVPRAAVQAPPEWLSICLAKASNASARTAASRGNDFTCFDRLTEHLTRLPRGQLRNRRPAGVGHEEIHAVLEAGRLSSSSLILPKRGHRR
jgi:hypothetical protein